MLTDLKTSTPSLRWYRMLLLTLVTGGSLCPSLETRAVAEDWEIVEPFVFESTCLVARVDPERVRWPDNAKLSAPTADPWTAVAIQLQPQVAGVVELLKTHAAGEPIYASVGLPISTTQVPLYLFRKRKPEEKIELVTAFLERTLRYRVAEHAGCLVVMQADGQLVDFDSGMESPLETLAEAQQLVRDEPISAVFAPPRYVWRTLTELSPELPARWGGGSSETLTEGVRWIALSADPETAPTADRDPVG